MKDAIQQILGELSSRGYRITKARQEVVSALAFATQPLAIRALCERIKSSDEASVYRTVRTLVEEGLAEEIVVQNQAPHYALAHEHHHHVICKRCGFMEHLECAMEHLQKPRSFTTIDSHEVTFYGLCKKCA